MEFSRQDYWSGLPFPSPALARGSHLFTMLSCWNCHSGTGSQEDSMNRSSGATWGSDWLTGSIKQGSSTFLAPGAGFMGDSFSRDWREGWFGDDSGTVHLWCTLFLLLLHQLHLRSSSIRSQRLGPLVQRVREVFKCSCGRNKGQGPHKSQSRLRQSAQLALPERKF